MEDKNILINSKTITKKGRMNSSVSKSNKIINHIKHLDTLIWRCIGPPRGGRVVAVSGDLIFETAGKGVVLGATSNVGNSNTLDDYEEGTFTPTYGPNITATYDQQHGDYVKIGKLVTVRAHITTSSVSSTSHSLLKMSGLPFQVDKRTPCSVRAWGFQSSGYDVFPTVATFEHNQTFLEFLKYVIIRWKNRIVSKVGNPAFFLVNLWLNKKLKLLEKKCLE